MNPGGGIYTNHPATKKIPFIQGSGIGATTQGNKSALNKSWIMNCKSCIKN